MNGSAAFSSAVLSETPRNAGAVRDRIVPGGIPRILDVAAGEFGEIRGRNEDL